MIKIKTYNMNLFNKRYRDMFGIREFEIYSYLTYGYNISYTRFKIVLAARLFSHTSLRGSLEQHCGLNF